MNKRLVEVSEKQFLDLEAGIIPPDDKRPCMIEQIAEQASNTYERAMRQCTFCEFETTEDMKETAVILENYTNGE